MNDTDIFIATPTHRIKSYCASVHEDAVYASFKEIGPAGARFVILCNSAANITHQFRPQTEHKKLKLGHEFYNHGLAIHQRIVYTCNILREMFLDDKDRNWFLMIEADVIVSPMVIQKIRTRILENPEILVLYTNCYSGFIKQTGFLRVNRLTLGLTAIHRIVLERIKFRFCEQTPKAFHDSLFATDCRGHGIGIHYDSEIKPIHMHHFETHSRGWESLPVSERRNNLS